MRQCKVFVSGQPAGVLQETDAGRYIFTYDATYSGYPVCLAMPVRTEAYESPTLFPFFFNMLSEGENRRMQAQLLHIDEADDFGILMATAQTDTIGTVTVKPLSL